MISEIKSEIKKIEKQIKETCPGPKCDAAKKAVSDKKEQIKKNEESLKETQKEIKRLQDEIKINFKTTGPAVNETGCRHKCKQNQVCFNNCIAVNVIKNASIITKVIYDIELIMLESVNLEIPLRELQLLQEEDPTNERLKEIEKLKVDIEKLKVKADGKLADAKPIFKGNPPSKPSFLKNPMKMYIDARYLLGSKKTSALLTDAIAKGKKELINLEAEKKKICGN